MALLDNIVGAGGYVVAGGFSLKWILDFLRDERSARRASTSESVAIKNLSEEVKRLSERVEQLEKDVTERDGELVKLNDALDEQRRLRRVAEDELDKERRDRRDLEHRVADLEQKL